MDIQKAMQAPEMQKRMLQLQEELGSKEISLSVGGGMVEVTMSGHKRVLALKIDPEALSGEVDMVEDMIVAAFNHTAEKVDDMVSRRTREIMAGLS
jgi:DNA-binding YbaB/EbfC family protein